MSAKAIRGYIDCPTCGTAGGMRITSDKNGHPFGFCTATCRQQLRVGPDPERVEHFERQHGAKLQQAEQQAAPTATAEPASTVKPEPVKVKRSGLADALHFMAGGAR